MAIKVKQVFPSRNYITIDCKGDIKVVFNPVGNGTEGDDELLFRAGRWAFRVNDFLAGKMMPNGDKESMNRKIYSLNIVYNDEDGEPVVTTTYVDPTSVITLDGSRVSINGFNEMATLEAQSQIKSLMATKAKQTEIINAINTIDFSSLATVAKQTEIINAINAIDFSSLATVAKQNEIKLAVEAVTSSVNAIFPNLVNAGVNGLTFNLLTNIMPPCNKLKCNVEIGFNNAEIRFIGADCSWILNSFRVLNCEKIVVKSGGHFEYYTEIFSSNEFLFLNVEDSRCECTLFGKDSNNVFGQIFNNQVGSLPMSARVIC